MLDAPGHHCAVAGMRAAKRCKYDPLSVIKALIFEQWNRGGKGAGVQAFVQGTLEELTTFEKRHDLVHRKTEKSHQVEQATPVVGHGRYETSGKTDDMEEMKACRQPFSFTVQTPDGPMAWSFCFNGNIANYPELRKKLKIFKPDVDTEAIRRILRQEIQDRIDAIVPRKETEAETDNPTVGEIRGSTRGAMMDVFAALEKQVDGAFSIVLANDRNQLFGYRDHRGMKPLEWAETTEGDALLASENSAFNRVFKPWELARSGEVPAGHMFAADEKGITIDEVMKPEPAHCFFEYPYFGRDLSTMNGVEILRFRRRCGAKLADMERGREPRKNGKFSSPFHHQLESVSTGAYSAREAFHWCTKQRYRDEQFKNAIAVGVPNSAIPGARALARYLGIRYVPAIRRKPGSGRSFTAGTQDEREDIAETKFDIDFAQFKGKDVYLGEDSVVRGTTMRALVQKLHDAGAKSIHLRIACPAIIGPCFYGIDFPTIRELIAGKYREGIIANGGELTEAIEHAMAHDLGVDTIKFLSMAGLRAAFEEMGMPWEHLCKACIGGTKEDYPTPWGRQHFDEEALVQLKIPAEREVTDLPAASEAAQVI